MLKENYSVKQLRSNFQTIMSEDWSPLPCKVLRTGTTKVQEESEDKCVVDEWDKQHFSNLIFQMVDGLFIRSMDRNYRHEQGLTLTYAHWGALVIFISSYGGDKSMLPKLTFILLKYAIWFCPISIPYDTQPHPEINYNNQ